MCLGVASEAFQPGEGGGVVWSHITFHFRAARLGGSKTNTFIRAFYRQLVTAATKSWINYINNSLFLSVILLITMSSTFFKFIITSLYIWKILSTYFYIILRNVICKHNIKLKPKHLDEWIKTADFPIP